MREIGNGHATVGLIGGAVERSLSAAIHNAAFETCGLPDRYALWSTTPDELATRIGMLIQPGMRGANVTIPYKQTIMPLLDERDPHAETIGAVNTIMRLDNGRLWGTNTDGQGFTAALREIDFDPRNRNVVVLGAGGAARAVVWSLIDAGVAQLIVANRTFEHAEQLLADMLAATPRDPALLSLALDDPELANLIAQADLLVNATPIGSDDHSQPIPTAWLHPRLLVYDLIYRVTPLLRAAEAAGARAADGLEMLVQQAALAFELWTDVSAPLDTMRQAALRARDQATV